MVTHIFPFVTSDRVTFEYVNKYSYVDVAIHSSKLLKVTQPTSE